MLVPRIGETWMGRKHRRKSQEFDFDPYDDYEDEFEDGLDDIGYLSKDFYSTDWDDPSGPESRFSSRRRIERRNDLKKLYSEIDDWDDFDVQNEW